MITNFEEITVGLSHVEATVVLPKVIELLKYRKGKDNAITNKKIRNLLTAMGHEVHPAQIRKMIHQIRMKGLVNNLLASAKGYYVSSDKEEIEKYVTSLRERAAAITAIADELE